MSRQREAGWRAYLDGLPAVVPPARLRDRVLAAWPAERAAVPTRWPGLAGWVLAAAAVPALALLLPWARPPAPSAPAPAGTDAVLASQALEARLLASPVAHDPGLQAGIAEIDRALGAAYRRGASGEELDGLWRARARAMQQGLAAAPPRPVRI